jgi:1-acyl-sn-glycerol-3-phosphate acyltransferase
MLMPRDQARPPPLAWQRRLSERFLDWFVPATIGLYARLLHGYVPDRPLPLPPRGPALIVSNHPCHADPALLIASCRRWIHYLQAQEEYDRPLLCPFFRLFGCIPVRRGGPDRSAIRRALDCLKHGAVVGLFPEGDLSPPGGHCLRPGFHGAALLALRSDAPVIPAFIAGTQPAAGIVVDWLRPAPNVRIRFGPPIDLSEHRGLPITRARLQAVTEELMERIAALAPQAYAAAATSWPG